MSLSERLDAARNRRTTQPGLLRPVEGFSGETFGHDFDDQPKEQWPEDAALHDPKVINLDSMAAFPVAPDELDPPADDTLPPGVEAVRVAATEALYERIGNRLNDPGLSEAQLHLMARDELSTIIGELAGMLTHEQRRFLIDDVADDTLGLGPLQRLIDDPTVTEIMVNGPDHIYVERSGRILRTGATFRSEDRLRRVIERIVSRVGRRIDESSPLVDARLPDGSRVNAIIPPLAVGGSALTIRKFATDPYQASDLVGLGTLTQEMSQLLYACVQARLNVLISGGTGTGKTTLLNVLSSFIPADDRVVTIEDAVELQLQQEPSH